MQSQLTLVLLLLTFLACKRSPTPPPKAEASAPKTALVSPSRPPSLPSPATVIHAGDLLGEPKLIHYVRPVYPAWARQRHVESVVEFRGTIGRDGTIRELTYVKGPSALVPYAAAAVHKWQYRPTIINGTPVEVVTYCLVPFTLHQ